MRKTFATKGTKVHEGTARKNVAIHGVRVRGRMVKLGHHALLPCCQRADGLRRMMRLVSGDGRTSRWCTVEESSHRLWCMSVMAVREECDEKIGWCGTWRRAEAAPQCDIEAGTICSLARWIPLDPRDWGRSVKLRCFANWDASCLF